MAHLARVIGIGIIAFDQRDRMPERLDLNEAEIQRKYRRRDHQPQHDPREVGAG